MSPPNENAARWDGARKVESDPSKPQSASARNQDFEDRRNAAACFPNQKQEEWEADFTGVLVTEELPAGTKCWVNVRERISRKGERYLSVVLKRWVHKPR
jgi:hypothetical protein